MPTTIVAVLVAVVAFAIPSAQGIVLSGFFTDDDLHTFEGDIDAIAAVGITKGCNPPANTHFCPNEDVSRGEMAAFLRRALDLPRSDTDFFSDDDSSTFEDDINAIAEAGITIGCNPPANTRYCPSDSVDRGAMAAFLRRALELESSDRDHFGDDNSSTFEDDINAIADSGITKGCDPPANTRYCPRDDVSRGAMAAFLRRANDLPFIVQQIPVGFHHAMSCTKDGEDCFLTVDLSAGRSYRIREGIFQVTPATAREHDQLAASSFSLTLDGSDVALTPLGEDTSDGLTRRRWNRVLSFSPGTHTLVGRWTWNGDVVQTNTITIRADS